MVRNRLPIPCLAALAILLLLIPALALAQDATTKVEHFKVYNTHGPTAPLPPVYLYDQFVGEFVQILFLDRFANPVNKNNEGLTDTTTHLSWWRIDHPEPSRHILVTNQFGQDQEWFLGDARWLLAPALKNPQPGPVPPDPPSTINHFKCYDAKGAPLFKPVDLEDQFGHRTAVVDTPVCFCNPVEKDLPDGIRYPILDPITHLACYRIDPMLFYGITVLIRDQFFFGPIYLEDDCLLCVPSLKQEVVPTDPGTWGHVKALYR